MPVRALGGIGSIYFLYYIVERIRSQYVDRCLIPYRYDEYKSKDLWMER